MSEPTKKLKQKRELLKNLDLDERERRLMPLRVHGSGLVAGVSSKQVIDEYLETLPADERDSWHLGWFDDKKDVALMLKHQGYEPCKSGKGLAHVHFMTDVLWRIPKELYDNSMLKQELSSRNESLENDIAETDKTAKYGEDSDDD